MGRRNTIFAKNSIYNGLMNEGLKNPFQIIELKLMILGDALGWFSNPLFLVDTKI